MDIIEKPEAEIVQNIHLRLGTEKFFHVCLNEKKLQITFRQGRLENNKEVKESVETFTENKETLDSAMRLMSDLINDKLDAGYELTSAEEQDISVFHEIKEAEDKDSNIIQEEEVQEIQEILKDKNEDKKQPEILPPPPKVDQQQQEEIKQEIDQREILMTDAAWNYFEEIDRKAIELELIYDFTNNGGIVVRGSSDSLEKFKQFIQRINTQSVVAHQEEEEKVIQVQENKNSNNNKDTYSMKEIKLSKSVKDNLKEIEDKAKELEIIYENLDDRLLLAGYQGNMLEFLTWLYDLTVSALEIENANLKEKRVFIDNNAFTQSEISISTFHRVNQQQILRKAEEWDILCEFGYDVIIVAGETEKLKDFKIYLHEVESNAKKALYPKYWDFHEINVFSQIEVSENSEEFKEVSKKFYQSLQNGVTITKLTRIQNKYLMDAYVTMLQKRQELNGGNQINRQLLFHGTRAIEPKKIYMSSDTGFDLQYSNPNGAYGKGIYFAVNSQYSVNGYGYSLGDGKSQIFLADVFVGNAFKSSPNRTLVKAPEGYDSVEATNSFYILYNNFHSYPLYLIEYSGGGNNLNSRPLIQPSGGLFPNNNINNPNAFFPQKPLIRPAHNNFVNPSNNTGLFFNNGLSNGGSSLFGGNQNGNQNQGGGLFFGQKPAMNQNGGGSIFGSRMNQSGSLFSGLQQQQQQQQQQVVNNNNLLNGNVQNGGLTFGVQQNNNINQNLNNQNQQGFFGGNGGHFS